MIFRSKWSRGWFALLTGTALLAAAMSPGVEAAAAAPPAKFDTIRVALMIHSDKINSSSTAATLSSDSGLTIGFRTPTGTSTGFTSAANQKSRFSLDQYGVDWLQTGDLTWAQALQRELAALKYPVYVFSEGDAGQPNYRVYSGPFADSAEASELKIQGGQAAGVVSLLQGAAPTVAGPLYWSAGTYTTEAEAQNMQASLLQSEIDSDIAFVPSADGTAAYAVWVGQAADQAQLNAVRQSINSKLPQINLQPVDPKTAYLLDRNEISDDGTPLKHFWLSASSGKLEAEPQNPDSAIRVDEKSARSYRGSLELSQYHGSLALIDEVNFEQYLYSVVCVEMGKGWPAEALKAQAVAARTFAMKQGVKYEIANITDSTLDQAYNGKQAEAADCVQAVDATAGLVLTENDALITPFYSANAGGMTADPSEVYGTAKPIPYLKSTPSPDDTAAKGKSAWVHAVLSDGTEGYITSEYIRETGETSSTGLPYYTVTGTNVNFRPGPSTDNSLYPPITKLNNGDRLLSLGQAPDSNSYSWTRGPYEANKLLAMINKGLSTPIEGPLTSLEVSRRGPSGRAIAVEANGKALKVDYPDKLRGLFGGLPSTRFEIEQTGRYTILGAEGKTLTASGGAASLTLLPSGGNPSSVAAKSFVMNGDGEVEQTTSNVRFIFRGTGTGHGLGLSQWGARGLAALGYDYAKILQYYYTGVTLTKVE